MSQVVGTSIADKVVNTAIAYGYSPEAAVAIIATIAFEGAGTELIKLRGERLKQYMAFCEKNNLNHMMPDSKIAFLFYDFPKNKNYNASRLKFSQTVDEAVLAFNEDYLLKTLDKVQFLSIVSLGNEIHRVIVGGA